jgi:photosystem II stability/assembly factor-like uncharacterized protein
MISFRKSYPEAAVWLLVLVMSLSVAAVPAGAQAQAASAQAAKAQPSYESAIKNLRWREIGPAIMGGRIDDFAVVESDPSIVYAATASGGLWKTTNAGTTWEPIFDNEAVSTIGDVTVAPSDPNIVWVGTGEPNNRQSSSWGNGVYRSTDGGKTWQHLGLAETHHIGRIVVHPRNPNVAYVAAVGRLWGPSRERGVYKTTDGGRTWTNVLFINEDTGVVDIAMDHVSPDTLYAAAYQRRRTVFGFNGGGPHGGLYKTIDGGATWKKLTNGLPSAEKGDIGRIGVNVYRGNPDIVYALVEHAEGGTFRSDDRGETWTKMSSTNPRPMYYSKIHIDPNNDLRIWVLGAQMFYSEDGGRNFRTNRVQRIHGDYHAFWINPANSNHMMVGSDGGIHWSWDAGRTWDFVNTIALGQFYEVGFDFRDPYNICGGLQDNGSWCGPSRTLWQTGATNDEWFRVGGGDGFYVQIDPTDPNIVYSESQDGNLSRRDLRAHESKSIRPIEKEGEARYRFQWNSPIVISAHDPKTIYYGGNFLFKSPDRGDTWTKISPDLTTGVDRDTLPIMGKSDRTILSRHDGVQQWPTITTISESAVNAGVLWVGTDDGNLQVTRDGGKSWTNVAGNVPGVPKGTYVSRVQASRHAEGSAYVTFDGHRMNDFGIYVFATTDFGKTWRDISKGLPRNNGVANVIREHHRNADLLFVGTEYGAFASFDRGASWVPLKMNLPTVPVDDIAIHPRENDLIFGTHGRAIWVLDDIAPLEQLNSTTLAADLFLFDPRPATAWRLYAHKGNTGHKLFTAENPPYGALLNFYLKSDLGERQQVRLTIQDKQGRTVRELTCGRPRPAEEPPPAGPGGGFGGGFLAALAAQRCEARAGINRTNWDLRYAPSIQPQELQQLGLGFGGAAAARGPMVEPGEYVVKAALVEMAERPSGEGAQAPQGRPQQQRTVKAEATKTVVVKEDSRIVISAEDRAARHQALMQLYEMSRGMLIASRTATGLRTALNNAVEAWKRPGAPPVPDNVKQAAEALLKKAQDACTNFASLQACGALPPEPLGSAGPPAVWQPPTLTQRFGRVFGALDGYTAAPTAEQTAEITAIQAKLRDIGAEVQKLVREELPALNKLMNEAGIPHIRIEPPRPGGGQGPGSDED